MFSPLQKAKFPNEPPQLKLTPNLRDKSKYVVHYRNLKLYTELGMVVTKDLNKVTSLLKNLQLSRVESLHLYSIVQFMLDSAY